MSTAAPGAARRTPLRWVADEWRRSDWMTYVITFVLTSAATVAALELWNSRLNVPLSYWGDALPIGAHFKTVREQGWYEYQPLLGAPFGQTYNDFPTADNLHFLMARLFAFVTPDWATAMNLYFIIGFPLAAIAALWLFRSMGISRTLGVPIAVLFAIAPYHFIRGEPHLWLASYYTVPLAIALVVDAIQGKPLWQLRTGGARWLRWASPRTLLTLGIVVLTGSAQSYYAVFFLVLLAFAGVVRLIRSGAWRRFWGAAIAGGVTAAVMLINMSPDILYTAFNGANPAGFSRGHIEAEVYALKLAQLLLPWPGHRIDALRELRTLYDLNYPLSSESPALGGLAALGLIALFLILAFMAATWGGQRARTLTATPQFRVLGQLAALTFVAFLFSTVGGLSTIISFVTTALRGWNRMSIVIMLLCLAAIGILGDALLRALQKRLPNIAVRRALGAGLATVILVVGYVDQTPANYSVNYAATIKQFDADAAWIAEVEASVPTGSMIIQLPYLAFPETVAPTGLLGSESLVPYLHSVDLRWTGGGIKGRPRSDWTGNLDPHTPEEIARLSAATGAAGIQVDWRALSGQQRDELEPGLDAAIGSPLTSADGRFSFYALDGVRADLEDEYTEDELAEFADRITDPVTAYLTTDFTTTLGADGLVRSVAETAQPQIELISERDEPTEVSIELGLDASGASPMPTSATLTMPDGSTKRVSLVDGVGLLRFDLVVPNGVGHITIELPGAASPAIALTRLEITDRALQRLVAG